MNNGSTFDWNDSIIDSRNINTYFADLTSELECLEDDVESTKDNLNDFLTEHNFKLDEKGPDVPDEYMEYFEKCLKEIDEAEEALNAFDREDLDLLTSIISDGESYSDDWNHGSTLIRENYFVEYIEDLINDCYEIPAEFNSGEWPFRHMKMDYEAAAEEAKVDYSTIEIQGETYYVR